MFLCVCVLSGVQCSNLFFTLEHISLFSILSFTNVLLNHLKYLLCYVHQDLYDISLMDQWMICEMSRQSDLIENVMAKSKRIDAAPGSTVKIYC